MTQNRNGPLNASGIKKTKKRNGPLKAMFLGESWICRLGEESACGTGRLSVHCMQNQTGPCMHRKSTNDKVILNVVNFSY